MKWNQHKSSWKNSRVHVPIQPSSSFDSMLSTAGSPGAFCWSFSSLHLPVETSDLICASLITDAKDRLDGCSNVPLIRRGMRQKRTPQVFLRDLSMLEGLVGLVDGIKEPWFKLLKWKQVGDPNLSKSKLQNLFFLLDIVPTSTLSPSFGSNSALRKTCLSTEFTKQNLGSLEGTENCFSSFHHWFLFRSYGSVNGNMSCSALNNPIYIYVYNLWTYGSLVRSDFKHWLPMPGIIQVRNALRKKPYHLGIPRHSKLAQPMGMV